MRFDAGRHPRAKLGFVLLATEQTIEDDAYRVVPDGIGIHFTRVAIPDAINADTLAAVGAELEPAAARLLPDGTLDVICYACTSGSVVLGEPRVFEALARGAPGAKCTSIITGVHRALKSLGARRIVVGTPYVDAVNAIERDYMQACGFEVLELVGLGIEHDSDMVRVAPDFLREFAHDIDRADADALFLSCGALRSLDIVDDLERELGKPVVVSNQAMLWDMLRLAGIQDRLDGFGELFRRF